MKKRHLVACYILGLLSGIGLCKIPRAVVMGQALTEIIVFGSERLIEAWNVPLEQQETGTKAPQNADVPKEA